MYKHYNVSSSLDLWFGHTPHKDIVTIMGFAPINSWQSYKALELHLLADLLDKGTRLHDKIAIANAIESLGAQFSVSVIQGHLCWSAQCLKADVLIMYPWIQEMLFESVFAEAEIKLWLKLSGSEVREAASDPATQASIAFNRRIYPQGHPMRNQTTEENIAWFEESEATFLRTQLETISFGKMRLIVVGDINEADHLKSLSLWPAYDVADAAPKDVPEVFAPENCMEHIEIADKTSLDVRIGQPLNMDVHHEDYWPLLLGVDALGGTFSARLMRTVRDVEGLTYGVNSSLQNLLPGYGGCFSVVITLAPSNLEKGIASTQFQIRKWWDEGVSEKELMSRKQGLIGRHAVRSTKTTQMAMLARYGLLYGFDESYAQVYVEAIEAVTVEQVNTAIKKWLHPDKMTVVSSGSK